MGKLRKSLPVILALALLLPSTILTSGTEGAPIAISQQQPVQLTAPVLPCGNLISTSIKGETRSQRGNHALKSALYLSAFAALADPASRTYYDRKRAQGKRHNAALICLARRRTDVLYAMLRDHTSYTPPTVTEPDPALAAA